MSVCGLRTKIRSMSGQKKRKSMSRLSTILAVLGAVLVLALVGCRNGSESGEHIGSSESAEHGSRAEAGVNDGGSSESREGREESSENDSSSESGEGGEGSGEHGNGSESGEEGEESGTQFALGETFDQIRAGARLILSYDSTANAFTGTVENTTGGTLSRVRVEVHLSNGIELGPTTPVDLAPGQVADVTLPAGSQPFASWSAHPEVG